MSRKKRQFRNTSKPKSHYDLKIWQIGYSRVLAVFRLIPKNWIYVRVRKVSNAEDQVTIRIEKLLSD